MKAYVTRTIGWNPVLNSTDGDIRNPVSVDIAATGDAESELVTTRVAHEGVRHRLRGSPGRKGAQDPEQHEGPGKITRTSPQLTGEW